MIFTYRQTSLLSVSAAAALTLMDDNKFHIPRLLGLASLACGLGGAISSTILLGSFVNAYALRVAWFEGGVVFVIALASPGGWLRWGIVTLQSSLLGMVWIGEPLGAKIVGSIILGTQAVLLLGLPIIGRALPLFGKQSVDVFYAANIITATASPFTPEVRPSTRPAANENPGAGQAATAAPTVIDFGGGETEPHTKAAGNLLRNPD